MSVSYRRDFWIWVASRAERVSLRESNKHTVSYADLEVTVSSNQSG